MLFTLESYRDVLSENADRGNIISSAWVVLAILGLAVVLFA
ncbi:MAG: hypothetical protein ACREEP_08035 [Dongiaceae bacterium]